MKASLSPSLPLTHSCKLSHKIISLSYLDRASCWSPRLPSCCPRSWSEVCGTLTWSSCEICGPLDSHSSRWCGGVCPSVTSSSPSSSPHWTSAPGWGNGADTCGACDLRRTRSGVSAHWPLPLLRTRNTCPCTHCGCWKDSPRLRPSRSWMPPLTRRLMETRNGRSDGTSSSPPPSTCGCGHHASSPSCRAPSVSCDPRRKRKRKISCVSSYACVWTGGDPPCCCCLPGGGEEAEGGRGGGRRRRRREKREGVGKGRSVSTHH